MLDKEDCRLFGGNRLDDSDTLTKVSSFLCSVRLFLITTECERGFRVL